MDIYPSGVRIDDRYEVVLGPREKRGLEGGMGIVYFCNDLVGNRPVALKTFKPELLPDQAARERFLREGSAWIGLGSHPHIVRCYDLVRVGNGREVYLVLEWIDNPEGRQDASLGSWLMPGRPLPVAQAFLFALQIAWGMGHAVKTIPGFVHRDLKPANLLIGRDRMANIDVNRLRVSDFGLVKIVAEEETERPSGSSPSPADSHRQQSTREAGTPRYMAPEQWRGEPVTAATDIYAVGCILYEMLTGQRAAAGDTRSSVQQTHIGGAIRPLPPSLPGSARAATTRCLALSPGARFNDWGELEAALGAAYSEVAGVPAPSPEPESALGVADRAAAGWSYSAIGSAYVDIGKATVAVQHLERARTTGQESRDRRLECYGEAGLGVAYVALGDPRRAVGCCEKGLAIARGIHDRQAEGRLLGTLARAYVHLGDPKRAGTCAQQALAIGHAIDDLYCEGQATACLGHASLGLGNAPQASTFFRQAFVIARENGDRREEANSLGDLGNIYLELEEVRRAIDYHQQALAIQREILDRRGEGDSLVNLGGAYDVLDDDALRAIGCYQEALVIFREISDRLAEGRTLFILGAVYVSLGEASRAIDLHEQALAIAQEVGDRQGEVGALRALGNIFRDQHDSSRAVSYCEQALDKARDVGNRQEEGQCLGDLGSAYHASGETRRAIDLHKQAVAIFREAGNLLDEATALSNLTKVYDTCDERHKAAACRERMGVILEELDYRFKGLGGSPTKSGSAHWDPVH